MKRGWLPEPRSMTRTCRLALPLALLLSAAPLAAQEVPYVQEVPDVPTSRLVVSGLAGGGSGWVVGALAVGTPLARTNPFGSDQLDDGIWTPGIVIGFELGQAVGIPLAVHLANKRRGDLRGALLSSLALGALGTVLLWSDDFDSVFESTSSQVVLITIPVAQLISSIYFARR